MKRPKLNALRAFEAAGRHLNFSNAGSELGISQAAVSQQIRNLETYLGAQLFIRRNRGLSLTGVGEAYRLAVHEALDRLDAVTDQLFPEILAHVVTIQCTPSVATLWLIPRLAHFRSQHPGIQLRIVTLDSDYLRKQQSHVDLEITALASATKSTNEDKLIKVEVVPVCSPILLEKTSLSKPADVPELHLLHILGYREDWHRWLRRFGLRDKKVPVGTSFDGSLMALESTIKGDGIMLGRRPFIDQYLDSGELVQPFDGRYALTTTYYLRSSGNTRQRAEISTVRDWLIDTIQIEV
jgi:LysR family glycine cleavage system transcriptional activator